RLPSDGCPSARHSRRHGGELRLGAPGRSQFGGPTDPGGGTDARKRGRGDRRRASLRRRCRERGGGGARRQGPRADGGLRRTRAGGRGVSVPTVQERFGPYGGRYVPEVLIPALDELSAAWAEARQDPGFRDELDRMLREYVGRPTPLYLASRLSERVGRRVYLKREDLAHTGAHKINNAVGQALLARRMGKE